jgi:dTDP-4-dehydrorhamnose 3,5-epimerase
LKFISTALEGVIIIEPDVYRDERGFFVETYHAERYLQGGVEKSFVQDNQSRSVRGTIRALHAQRKHPQGKLVRALVGTVFDVVVDIRRCSPTFRRWISVEISAENFRQIYVPPGFAHGICILSAIAEIAYKCTDYYDPADELRIIWNDPAIGVEWPVADPILSAKDSAARTLAEQFNDLPQFGERTA